MTDVLGEVHNEMQRAHDCYGPFSSAHESLGVLLEEIAELMEAIRGNVLENIRIEAIQVSAVAARLAVHCRNHEAFRVRSGG